MRGSRAALGLDAGERVVAAAVVDEDDLEGRRDALDDGDQARAEGADIGRLVEDRDDDAELG